MFQVAELVATLRLDKGQFDSSLGGSQGQLEGLGRTASSVGGTLGGVLVSGMRAASVVATGLAAATAATLKSLLSTGVAYNTLQQTSRAALTTLLGGAKAANEQMDKLDVFAKTSPFSKSVFIEAQQQLIGFGASADKVIPMLSSINDAVAAIGGSNDDIAAISSSLADVIGTGKISGDTLNELGMRGINAADIIAKGFGVSSNDIRKSIEKGTIDSAKALDVLVSGMQEKFAGASDNVKNTMTGASDRVKAATRDIGAALAEPFVSKYGGGRLVQWSNDWADALRALEKRVPAVVSIFMDRFSPAIGGVSIMIGNLKTAIRGFDLTIIERGLDGIVRNAPAVAGLTGAILGLTSGALSGIPVVGGLLAGLNPLALALVGVVAASPEMRAALGEVFEALKPLLPAVAELAGALSGALSSALLAGVPLVEGAAQGVGLLVQALIPLLGLVTDAAEAFSTLPPEIQSMIVAFTLFLALRGSLTGMFEVVQSSVGGLVTKLKDGGLKGALGGIMSLFGGPWGLAIGGAMAVLGLFAQQQSETKNRVEEFTASLDENTGAITANTAVTAGKKLMDYADTFKAIRLNVKDASDAVANGGQAYDNMMGKIDGLREAALKYQAATTTTNSGQKQSQKEISATTAELVRLGASFGLTREESLALDAGGIGKLRNGMSELRGEVTQSSENWKTLNQATEDLKPTTLRLSDAIKTVGDSSANTTDRLRAYQDVIDAMNGKSKSTEQTQRDLSKSTRDLAGFLGEVDANGQRFNQTLAFAADGSIALNDAGDRLNSMLEPLATRAQTAALAAADLAKAQGRAGDAAKDADAALAPFRATLQGLADQGLLTQDQVNRLSVELFGVPGETTAVITDKDSAGAVKLKVDELTRAIVATPNKEIVITEPLSPTVIEKLKVLGYTVTTLPNGNIKVTETGADETGKKIDDVAGKPRGSKIFAQALTDEAERTLAHLARNRSMIITASNVVEGSFPGIRSIAPAANGALFEYYATGGMRHPRLTPMAAQATIVPQNTWRVVGDNMKVPELYAPLDGSARSIALLREGAARSGFDMVPRGTKFFADGGMFGESMTPAPATQVTHSIAPGARPAPVYQFTGPVTVTNQAEFESMTRQRATDRNAALGIPAIEREL